MVNQKIDITKYIAEQAGLGTDEKSIRKLNAVFWQNPRKKVKGGLKLTEKGFEMLGRYIDYHRVRFETPPEITTSQLVLRLDNLITCPWYLTRKEVYVFDDKMAVQLVLFSGNIIKFVNAKAENLRNTLTNS
jgi:hypothetical protein